MNNEDYVGDYIRARLGDSYSYEKNIEYGNKANRIGEIDLIAYKDNYDLVFEIKASEKHRNKAVSQLERAIDKCDFLQHKRVFGIFAYKDKKQDVNLEWLAGNR